MDDSRRRLPSFEVGDLVKVSPRFGTAKMWFFPEFGQGPVSTVNDKMVLLCLDYKAGWNHVIASSGDSGWVPCSVLERIL